MKIRSVALQRSEERRARYAAEVTLCSPNMFVFIDEMGSDCRPFPSGKRCVAKRLLVRGERMSVMTAITLDGILDPQFIHGTTNGKDFGEFFERQLLPHLMLFSGRNSNSIVVMDTPLPSLHCKCWSTTNYFPLYSPGLNPTEEVFHLLKHT